MSRIRSVLACKICGAEAGDRLLDCGHGVCINCIEKSPNIECPACGGKTVVSLKTKVKNYAITNLWDIFKEMDSVEVYSKGRNNLRGKIIALPLKDNEIDTVEKTKTCWICDKNPTSLFCNSCHSFICDECAKITHDKNLGHVMFPYSFDMTCSDCQDPHSNFYLFKSKQNFCTDCIIKRLKSNIESGEKDEDGHSYVSIREGIYPIGSVKARTVEILKRIKSGEYNDRLYKARSMLNKTRSRIRANTKKIIQDMRDTKDCDIQLNNELMDQNVLRVEKCVNNDNNHIKLLISKLVNALLYYDDIIENKDNELKGNETNCFYISEKRKKLAGEKLKELKEFSKLPKEKVSEQLLQPDHVLQTFKNLTILDLVKPILEEIDKCLKNFEKFYSFSEKGDDGEERLVLGPKYIGSLNPTEETIVKSMKNIKLECRNLFDNTDILKSVLSVDSSCINIENMRRSSFDTSRLKIETGTLNNEQGKSTPGTNLTKEDDKIINYHYSNTVILNRLPICFCSAKYFDEIRNANKGTNETNFIDAITQREFDELSEILNENIIQSVPSSPKATNDENNTRPHNIYLGCPLMINNKIGYVMKLDEMFMDDNKSIFRKELPVISRKMNVFNKKMTEILGIHDIFKNMETQKGDELNPNASLLFTNEEDILDQELEQDLDIKIPNIPSIEISFLNDILFNNRYNGAIIPSNKVFEGSNDKSLTLCPISYWLCNKSMCSFDFSKGIYLGYHPQASNYIIVEKYDYRIKKRTEDDNDDENEEDVPKINCVYPGIHLVRFPGNKTINYFRFGAEENINDLVVQKEEEKIFTLDRVCVEVHKDLLKKKWDSLIIGSYHLLGNNEDQIYSDVKTIEGKIVFFDGKDYYVNVGGYFPEVVKVNKIVDEPKKGSESSENNVKIKKISNEETLSAMETIKKTALSVKNILEIFKANTIFWLVFFTSFNAIKEDVSDGKTKDKDDEKGYAIVDRYIEAYKCGKIEYNKDTDIQKCVEYTRVCLARMLGVDENDDSVLSRILPVFGACGGASQELSENTMIKCSVVSGKQVTVTNAVIGASVEKGPDWKYEYQDSLYEEPSQQEVKETRGIGVITKINGEWVTVKWKNGFSNSYKVSYGKKPGEAYLMYADTDEPDDSKSSDLKKNDDSRDNIPHDKQTHGETEDNKEFKVFPEIQPYMISMTEKLGGRVGMLINGYIVGNTWKVKFSKSEMNKKFIPLKPLNLHISEDIVGLPVTIGKHFVFSENFNLKKLKKIVPDGSDGTLASGIVIPYGIIIQGEIIQGGWVWVCWLNMVDIAMCEATNDFSRIIGKMDISDFVIDCYPVEKISSLSVWPISTSPRVKLEDLLEDYLINHK